LKRQAFEKKKRDDPPHMRSQEAPAGAQTPPNLPTESEQHIMDGGIREYTMPPSEEKPGDARTI